MIGTFELARTTRRLGGGAVAFVAMAIAAGCTVGPDFKAPDKPAIEGYTPENLVPRTASAPVHGGEAQSLTFGADIPGQWWQLYRSTELDALVEQALKANPDLDAAQASLRQANELLYAQQGALFPTISANGSGTPAVVQRSADRVAGIDNDVRRHHGVAQRLLCARRVGRHAPAGRIAGGAGRVPAFPARGDLSDADLQCRRRRRQSGVVARPDRRHQRDHPAPGQTR